MEQTGVSARLRGISAVSERVAWASGSGGTVLSAIDERTVYVLSIGNGPASRIYKTTDAGTTWTLQFKSEDQKAFYDAMSFWDNNHGIVVGDSIDGQFCILITADGGHRWSRVSTQVLPPALENEGAFAASGTNIAVFGKSHAWIGTGGAKGARVLHTTDRGRTWQVSETPLHAGNSAGIFSVAFRDAKHGVIVGGDYKKEKEALDNIAVTSDGGATWSPVRGLSGFRSVVAYLPDAKGPTLIALGPSGADISTDDGRSWRALEGPGFDTLSFARRLQIGWAAGAGGRIGKLTF
jgi:photosystem II stability/assembly factor-like uncharacterized protein